MSDLPFLPLWIAKYEARTGHLSLEEDGAYMRLLRLSWVTPKCQLPADDVWIRRMMRVDQATYDRVVRPILDEFFYRADGAWRNAKLREIYGTKSGVREVRSTAGKISGQKRREKSRESVPTNDEQNAYKPEPEARAIKAAAGLLLKIRQAMGPGIRREIPDKTIQRFAEDWLALGATGEEIVEVVRRQTEFVRKAGALRSLSAITEDIEDAIAARAPKPIDPHPEPLARPPGTAGVCLAAIIARHGEVKAAIWLKDAEWTETEVQLPSELARAQVENRFRSALEQYGIRAVLRPEPQQKTA